MSIKELNQKRSNWVQTNRENGFEEGIGRLLTELYPDNAHFIYELLQNAEDAKANTVNFILHSDYLEFVHNGKRTFEEKDIESISSIGNSTKANDINQIGKFGVGFKAVFAYTDTPKIYSGKYAFQIRDLVVPEEIDDIERDATKTIFHFPFNNQKKSLSQSVEEIQVALEKIHDNTLLFLQNIQNIHCSYRNVENVIQRTEHSDVEIEIHNSLKGTSSRWLRFKKYLPESTNLYVATAYAIRNNEKTERDEVFIIDGEVSIFFPAEKEKSNLKFHIHAPSASTVARDSIKDLDENRRLIELVAETITDSFEYIKTNGFLNTSFLTIMPNSEDNLSYFYQTIFMKIVNKFRTMPYVPVQDGLYYPANECFKGTNKIKELLNEDILLSLNENIQMHWVESSFRYSRADIFMQNLGIKDFTERDLYTKLFEIYDDCFSFKSNEENQASNNHYNLFEQQKDEWFLKLYSYFYDYVGKNWFDKRKSKFLLKLDDGSMNTYGKDCFFNNLIRIDGFIYLKKETYSKSPEDDDSKRAKSFLNAIGVVELGEKEKIKSILNLYTYQNYPTFEKHIDDLHLFLKYYADTNDNNIFQLSRFIHCIDDESSSWCYPDSIVLDSPFAFTGLNVLTSIDKTLKSLDKKYLNALSDKELFLFLKLLTETGSVNKLELREADVHKNSNFLVHLYSTVKRRNERGKDWTIKYLDILLKKIDLDISILIWKTMCNIDKFALKATYSPNQSMEYKYTDSQLVYILKNHVWIPQINGKFYLPSEADPSLLPSDFVYDDRNGWLKAIGFGDNIRKNQEEYLQADTLIQERVGYDLSTLEELSHAGITSQDLQLFLHQRQSEKLKTEEANKTKTLLESLKTDTGKGSSSPFVEKSGNTIGIQITDTEKYISKSIEKRSENSNQFSKFTYNIKKQSPEKIESIRNFLYQEYEGHCQICGDTFEYNNKNYFEITSLNTGKERDINVEGNTLCLCPKHRKIFEFKLRELTFLEELKDLEHFHVEDFEKAFGKYYDFVSKDDSNNLNDSFYNLHDDDAFSRDNIRFLPIKIFDKTEYLKITEAHEIEIINELNRK